MKLVLTLCVVLGLLGGFYFPGEVKADKHVQVTKQYNPDGSWTVTKQTVRTPRTKMYVVPNATYVVPNAAPVPQAAPAPMVYVVPKVKTYRWKTPKVKTYFYIESVN